MNPEKQFSIITPSFNHGKFIEDNILSVLDQGYENFEHIIIDGGSTDNTVEILKKYKHLKWVSEKDKGAANAINKGFKLAAGDIFGWINADDYYDKNILKILNDEFSEGYNMVYGNLTFVNEFKKLNYEDKTIDYDLHYLLNTAPDVRQPCTFFSKELFRSVSGLNENLKLVFDFDLLIKMLKTANVKYIDKNLAFYRDYEMTLTRKFVRKQAVELFFTGRKYGTDFFSLFNKKVLKKLLYGKLD